MTRQQLKEKKDKEEKKFIESIKGENIDGKLKGEFRKTSLWKAFRCKFYIKEQKLLKNGRKKDVKNDDAITLKPLNRTFNLHHMQLDSRKYTELNEKNFIPVNTQTHTFLHWLYSYYRKDPLILERLKKYLDQMCELNDFKDVRDFN